MIAYVFFNRRTRNTRWWHWLLDKKFNHVFLATELGSGTMVIDCLLGRLRVAVYTQGLDEYVLDAARHWKVAAVLQCETADTDAHPLGPLFGLHSCVTITRSFFHLPGWIFTPRQLYNRLLSKEHTHVIKNPIA